MHRPFGTGQAEPLGKEYGIEDIITMPIDSAIAQSSEDGVRLIKQMKIVLICPIV